jgi:hypothetical protein
LLWKDDEFELIRDPALWSDFERGSRVGDVPDYTADRYVADPDQTHVKNAPTLSSSRVRQVDDLHLVDLRSNPLKRAALWISIRKSRAGLVGFVSNFS